LIPEHVQGKIAAGQAGPPTGHQAPTTSQPSGKSPVLYDDTGYRLGLTASQVVWLIGLLLVFASQKIVHNVRDEMAEFVVPLRKKIKDSLTRQNMQNIRGLH